MVRGLIVAIRRSRTDRSSSATWVDLEKSEQTSAHQRLEWLLLILFCIRQKLINNRRLRTGWWKNWDKLGKAMSRFIIYNRLPPSRQISLDKNVNKHRLMCHRNEGSFLAKVYFQEEYLKLHNWIHRTTLERTLMCNGWKGHTSWHLTNFLLYWNKPHCFFSPLMQPT